MAHLFFPNPIYDVNSFLYIMCKNDNCLEIQPVLMFGTKWTHFARFFKNLFITILTRREFRTYNHIVLAVVFVMFHLDYAMTVPIFARTFGKQLLRRAYP